MTFSPLDHPIIWSRPPWLGPSGEEAHLSLGQLLVDLVRPRSIVDVGSRSGTFYTALCHAVQETAIDATAIALLDPAVRHGRGDPSVDAVVRLHEQRFSTWSRIELPATASGSDIPRGTVDLLSLHPAAVDDTGAAAAGSQLVEWLACLSARGVAVLHDSNVTSVRSLWVAGVRELESRHRAVRLLHGDGLVLVCPGDIPARLAPFLECAEEHPDVVRTFFLDRGTRVQLESALHARDREAEAAGHQARRLEESLREEARILAAARDDALAQRDHAIAERDHAISGRDSAMAERDRAIAERDDAFGAAGRAASQLGEVESSAAWRAVTAYRSLVERMLPSPSVRRRAYRRSIHVLRGAARACRRRSRAARSS